MKYMFLLGLLTVGIAPQRETATASLLSKFYVGGEVHLIGPGLISTSMGEYSPTYDAQRNELYFMRRTPGVFDYTIYRAALEEAGWSQAEIAPFSGQYRDAAPYLSPDGNTLFFDSRRPLADGTANSIDLWYTQRSPGGWQPAKLLSEPSRNTTAEPVVGQDEFGPAVDEQGNLYFYSFRQPYREGARYVSFPQGYTEVALAEGIPDPSWRTFISYLYISPDGRLAIMEGKSANGNDDSDLYCSCSDENGSWSAPKAIPQLNTTAGEGGPFLTADGQHLLFVSDRPTASRAVGSANLYVVEAAEIVKFCQS